MSFPCINKLNIHNPDIKAHAIDDSVEMADSDAKKVAAKAWTSTFRAPSVTNPQTIKPSLVDQFYTKFNQTHTFSSIPANPFRLGMFENVTRSNFNINLTPTITFSVTSSQIHFTQSYAQKSQDILNSENCKLSDIANAFSNKLVGQISLQLGNPSIIAPDNSQTSTTVSLRNNQLSASRPRHSDKAYTDCGHFHFPPLNLVRPFIYKIVQTTYQSEQSTFSISLTSQYIQLTNIDTHKDAQSLSCAIYKKNPYIPEHLSENKIERIGHHGWLSAMYTFAISQMPTTNIFQDSQSLSCKNENRICQISYKSAFDYMIDLIGAYVNQEYSYTSRVSQVQLSLILSIRTEFFQNNSDHIPNVVLNQIGISINLQSFPDLTLSQPIQSLLSCIQSYNSHNILSIDSEFDSNYIFPPQLTFTYSRHIYTIEYPSYHSNLLCDGNLNTSSRLLLNESTSSNSNSESPVQSHTLKPRILDTHTPKISSSNTRPPIQHPLLESYVPPKRTLDPKLPKLIRSLYNDKSWEPTTSTTLELAYGEFI
jgi:hypothetical protein